jgi:hypothetical protein
MATKTKTSKVKKVLFRTKDFALLPAGSIIECYLLNDDGERALLYSPPLLGDSPAAGCGVFLIAKKSHKNANKEKACWEDVGSRDSACNNWGWINRVTIDPMFQKFLAQHCPSKGLKVLASNG